MRDVRVRYRGFVAVRDDGPMSSLEWIAIAMVASLAAYALLVVGLLVVGRRTAARALAGFIPDCLVLLKRLLADRRTPRSSKVVLLVLVAYLSVPIDLVPDFIPVVGQLDDVIVAALALRYALRADGPDLLREHWPGPEGSLAAVIRLAYGRTRRAIA
jgi:uncharacterized membrane protein YkvA (DUF1232 family)